MNLDKREKLRERIMETNDADMLRKFEQKRQVKGRGERSKEKKKEKIGRRNIEKRGENM